MATIKDLHKAVAAVAPIHGVTKGRIDFKESATAAQREAAAEVLKSFDWSKESRTPIPQLTDEEILWVRQQREKAIDAVR